MDIIITNTGGVPIYEQISSQIKKLIISGVLKEGDTLPSMRLLAKELRISVITTKRAYEELEKDGFIVSFTGRGSFVAGKNLEAIKEEQFKAIEEQLQKCVTVAKTHGICLKELIDILSILYGDDINE